MQSTITASGFLCCCLLVTPTTCGESQADWMLELSLHGQRIEGAPIAWNTRQVVLLGRDGRLWQFPPEDAKDYRPTSDRFYGYPPSELRAVLRRELGRQFDVSGTSHYLVAHPAGEQNRWADRFEDLYRRFVRYFSVRGFRLTEPAYPLVGIVFGNRGEFARYAASHGEPAGPDVLGYYSNQSNRIVLYDIGPGAAASGRWQQNAATIIHEATHQAAFNTGIHSRYVRSPLWVVEGLATMLEGVVAADMPSDGPRQSRVNRGRLGVFRDAVTPQHRPEILADLIASDRIFRTSPGSAYAEAWALTFYLMETQPARYGEYLAKTSRRPAFERYTAKQRTSDFTAVFGDNWTMLEAQLLRFMAELK